ncbi:DUF1153 domain-containing protein [Halomonas sp. I1]|uniref:DUF1153 domain-containing protein n=1 Tax=Halomonas sp. I1 TaxID=393536 RepID=UPI0028DE6DDA|nr:DUF1153 domain-containing protein [Halomonas sp. I1]MDT8893322.1 DUF1153 domain-containing protein [Halomonas sp. I1]
MSNDIPIKQWTAKRKASVVMGIVKGKTMVAEVVRQRDLTVSEVEGWIDEAQRNMENGLRARPKDIREQYESDLWETKGALGEAHLQINALKKVAPPARRGRELVRSLQVEMAQEGRKVSLAKLCRRLGFPRRSLCYRCKSAT